MGKLVFKMDNEEVLKVLAALNKKLRCPICDEILDTAVHFNDCSHTCKGLF